MEIHKPLNYVPDGVSSKDYTFDKRMFKKLTRNGQSKIFKLLPKTIDHTPNMTPVKNQGRLGSCVSFATIALKEWQEWQEYLKVKNRGQLTTNRYSDLSEQWVYHEAKKIDGIRGEGTTIRAALTVLKNYGVPPEESWLYSDRIKGTPKKDSKSKAHFTRIGDFFRINHNINHLRLALLHTPVPIGVITTDSFMRSSDGIIKDDKINRGKHGGHAICLVGYNDKTKLFKFKNSWSVHWGQKGYGYISYDYFKKYCMVAWAVKDIHIPVDYLKKVFD